MTKVWAAAGFAASLALAGGCRRGGEREGAALVRGPFPRQSLPDTEVRPLARSANGRAYQLHVALPESYDDDPQRHYPVLYLCDAYWDFPLVRAIAANL